MSQHPKASIIIPSLRRPESLEKCIASLYQQTEKSWEVIVEGEEGELARIRNKGASKAKGDILIFIDDDVLLSPEWLSEILKPFRDRSIAGTSGPAVIKESYRSQRDIFRYPWLKKIYDFLFLNGRSHLPGHITPAGSWTTGACEEDCSYEGPVDFLEACNMAFRADIFREVGGFDTSYRGIGDWSEPDLCFRIRRAGHRLWFNPKAKLYHCPSRSGAFKKRSQDSHNRLDNYMRFSSLWVRPCFRHSLYKAFLRTYYAIKTIR